MLNKFKSNNSAELKCDDQRWDEKALHFFTTCFCGVFSRLAFIEK